MDSPSERGHANQWPLELIQRLYPTLLRMAAALGSGRDGEDLVQDTLYAMLLRYPDFVGIDHPLGYARTVLLRLIHRRLGSRARDPIPLDLAARLEGIAPVNDWEAAADRSVDLEKAMGRLPRGQRACLYLRFTQGLTDREIARVLGCRPSTARSQIARGLATMRRQGTLGEANDGKG